LAKLAEEVGDIGGQIAAIDRAIEIYRERRETGYAIQALQGRALALAEAGEYQEAEADYRAAHDQATMAGSLPLMSQVGRNLARFLADRDHQIEAESYFKQALEQARQAAHPELAGKALVAWGIFHTHQGRKNQAHACFDEAIPLLPQDDPHVRAANDHIESINSETACACVDPIQIAARSLRRDVRRALPPRCARSVEVLVVGDGFEVRLDLARTLTDPEQAALQKVMDRKRK
jgi:tetratricopeptide (TPR) repeat protein